MLHVHLLVLLNYIIQFNSIQFNSIQFHFFYENGKKCVPSDIYNIRCLQFKESVIEFVEDLHTQSFTVIEVVHLINVLIIQFNCKCTIHYQEGKPVIYISSCSVRKLRPELLKHISESMHYKLTGNHHVLISFN